LRLLGHEAYFLDLLLPLESEGGALLEICNDKEAGLTASICWIPSEVKELSICSSSIVSMHTTTCPWVRALGIARVWGLVVGFRVSFQGRIRVRNRGLGCCWGRPSLARFKFLRFRASGRATQRASTPGLRSCFKEQLVTVSVSGLKNTLVSCGGLWLMYSPVGELLIHSLVSQGLGAKPISARFGVNGA